MLTMTKMSPIVAIDHAGYDVATCKFLFVDKVVRVPSITRLHGNRSGLASWRLETIWLLASGI
jgi:hypothetical protein